MIKGIFTYNEGFITNVNVKGHAMYANSGEDIVCASVSTAIILTINAIERLGLKETIEFEIDDGYLNLNVVERNNETNALLQNLEDAISQLNEQFTKNIKYQKKEG